MKNPTDPALTYGGETNY